MSRSQDPDHFFQTSQSIAETSRKAAKSKNEHGAPIRLKSKILAIIADPTHEGAVYLAESVGQVRRIVLDVGKDALFPTSESLYTDMSEISSIRQANLPRSTEVPPLLYPLLLSPQIIPYSLPAVGTRQSGPGLPSPPISPSTDIEATQTS